MVVKYAESDMIILPLLLGVTITLEDCLTLEQPLISMQYVSELELDCVTKFVEDGTTLSPSVEATALAVDEYTDDDSNVGKLEIVVLT